MRIIPSPILEHDIVLNGIRNKNEPREQEIEKDSQRGITGVKGKEYHHDLIARTLEWYIKGIEELGPQGKTGGIRTHQVQGFPSIP